MLSRRQGKELLRIMRRLGRQATNKQVFEACQRLGFEPTQDNIGRYRHKVFGTRVDPGRPRSPAQYNGDYKNVEEFNYHPYYGGMS